MKRAVFIRAGDVFRITDAMLVIDGKAPNGFKVTEFSDEFDEDGNLVGVNTRRRSYSITRHDLEFEIYRYTGDSYSFFWYTEDPDYIDEEV